MSKEETLARADAMHEQCAATLTVTRALLYLLGLTPCNSSTRAWSRSELHYSTHYGSTYYGSTYYQVRGHGRDRAEVHDRDGQAAVQP
eukprot:scaffold117411_cov42-Phaeocystis_antarctica.AAC.1